MVRQVGPGFFLQDVPVTARRDGNALFIGHLQEEEIGELFDIVAVVDAIVAERVAEAPEFVDDVSHVFLYAIA